MADRRVLTEHAEKGCQQRGIGRDVIELIMAHGTVVDHRGARTHFMDKKARERTPRELGPAEYSRFSDRLDTYIVAGDHDDRHCRKAQQQDEGVEAPQDT